MLEWPSAAMSNPLAGGTHARKTAANSFMTRSSARAKTARFAPPCEFTTPLQCYSFEFERTGTSPGLELEFDVGREPPRDWRLDHVAKNDVWIGVAVADDERLLLIQYVINVELEAQSPVILQLRDGVTQQRVDVAERVSVELFAGDEIRADEHLALMPIAAANEGVFQPA